MKIVLTHGYFLEEDEKEKGIMRPYATLGLLYISAFLKEHNKSVTVLDSTFMNRKDWQKAILEEQPSILAFYSNLVTKVTLLQIRDWVANELPNCRLVIGGPDVRYNLENYLKAGFEYAVIGEGEQTMLELCEAIESNTKMDAIQGIAYLKNGVPHENAERVKIREIADLPFPDRSAIDMEKYLSVWQKHHGKRTLNISTQRGCPYTCKWCSTAVYGQSYRRNSPERVVEEIIDLRKEFQVEALWFVDDVFTVSHKWISELHEQFKKADLKIDFECISRAERLNENVLIKLKEMGCFRIWIGAESGSQRIIDKMDRRVNVETVQSTIRLAQKLGIEAGTFIMVGYPEEEHEDILQTMKHIEQCNPSVLTLTKAYPIKGTGLYNEVESKIIDPLPWTTSSDRDIRFELPYSDNYYNNAIRYLMNGWQAKKTGKILPKIKQMVALWNMKRMR
jgi:radical SAM superfamily enzyme YgiQ (UPF0313 family)